MLKRTILGIWLIVAMSACIAFAQTAPSTSVTLPPGPLKVVITGIQGIVQAHKSADQKWEKATVDMELAEGAELRTGPRSAVQFTIGDDQTVTLDRLGTIQILRANFESGKVFTDLGMKYGRTRYDIETAGREHDAKVHSPSSVLAVRGTDVILYDQPPYTPQAISLTGRAFFRDSKKLAAFGGKNAGKTKIDTKSDSAAATAKDTTSGNITSAFTGQSANDNLLALEKAFGGFSNLGVASLFDAARSEGFGAPVAVLIKEQLFINMSWTGLPGGDVDLAVLTPPDPAHPNGELVDAAHPVISGPAVHSGNSVADDLGNGVESVAWTTVFPTGTYTIRSTLKTPGSAKVNVDVFSVNPSTNSVTNFGPNGQPISLSLTDKAPALAVPVRVTATPSASGTAKAASVSKKK